MGGCHDDDEPVTCIAADDFGTGGGDERGTGDDSCSHFDEPDDGDACDVLGVSRAVLSVTQSGVREA